MHKRCGFLTREAIAQSTYVDAARRSVEPTIMLQGWQSVQPGGCQTSLCCSGFAQGGFAAGARRECCDWVKGSLRIRRVFLTPFVKQTSRVQRGHFIKSWNNSATLQIFSLSHRSVTVQCTIEAYKFRGLLISFYILHELRLSIHISDLNLRVSLIHGVGTATNIHQRSNNKVF